MELEPLRMHMLDKNGVTEEQPFGPDTLVFKVMGKMFALVGWQDSPLRVNLKCDPELALTLREQYEAVIPGYHMNKKHWNTMILDGSIPADEMNIRTPPRNQNVNLEPIHSTKTYVDRKVPVMDPRVETPYTEPLARPTPP